MISKSKLFQYKSFDSKDLDQRFNKREGEVKLGDTIVSSKEADFVILGIEESIGPKANKGRGGAQYGFEAFLNKFLNMQSNESLIGDNTCVLGKISCTSEDVCDKNDYKAVEELDEFVFKILSEKVNNNQIPIIIGGGHNNAYPIIKYIYFKNGAKLNIVNLDAHADYRPLEGRHSGNPFSYAFSDGFIRKYFVLGLHQRYNSQRILDDLKKDNHIFTFYEDYIDGTGSLKVDTDNLVETMLKSEVGLELDLDSIENMPSSASSPSGVSLESARYYVRKFAKLNDISYFHLPEGAPMNDSEKAVVGKALAYLVTDFISSHGV